IGLVTSDNLIAVFICWELTTLFSFLLIGFDVQNRTARFSALLAALLTGLGGIVFLIGAILLSDASGSLNLSVILSDPDLPVSQLGLLLIIIACLTKSAQWPFHFWLPRAMVAPTPVSAY